MPGVGGSGQVVGFRPEHIRLGNGVPDAVRLTAPVEVVEYLGDDQLVHLAAKDHVLLAKLPVEPRIAAGSKVELTIPRNRIYLFDAETGAVRLVQERASARAISYPVASVLGALAAAGIGLALTSLQ